MLRPLPKSAGLLLTLTLATTTNATPSFQPLGFLPNTAAKPISQPYDISPDGRVIVGISSSGPGSDAFIWTSDQGMRALPTPAHIAPYGRATAVSADGTIVAGNDVMDGTGRWVDGVFQRLNSPATAKAAWDMSADGSVIVGAFEMGGTARLRAYRWTADAGAITLPTIDGGTGISEARGVSDDGTTVVGFAYNTDRSIEAFRWSESEGTIGLGHIPGAIPRGSDATAASADGSVIVGAAYYPTGIVGPFRWTREHGMVALGLSPTATWASAYHVSADGSVVVGYQTIANQRHATIWTSSTGMRNLQDLLTNDHGLDLAGYTLTDAWALSADGTTIVGAALNPQGLSEAWIVHLPEPTHLLPLSIALLSARRRHRADIKKNQTFKDFS